jgi:pimeloyl-ACP methyl ester carboxylesterase
VPARTDCQIKFNDGRVLSYAEYGDPQGKPVLHFHGAPSSRFELSPLAFDAIATRLHARVILPERPGFGLSDSKPNRTILDWPDDVTELAAALHLGRFAVMGFSAVGPYTAACAYKIPQRLSAAGIVGGLGPLDAPGAFGGLAKTNRLTANIARKAPWLLRPIYWSLSRRMHRNPGKIIDLVFELAEPDKALMAQIGGRELFIRMFGGGFQQRGRGEAWEAVLLLGRPWGFRLEDIRMPVYLWHGEMDAMNSIDMGRRVAKSIPDCRSKFYPQEGHFSLLVNHYEELLRAIVC